MFENIKAIEFLSKAAVKQTNIRSENNIFFPSLFPENRCILFVLLIFKKVSLKAESNQEEFQTIWLSVSQS